MGRINRVVSSGEATARLIFVSYDAVRWFIFMPRRKRNESNLFSLIERRSFSSSGVRREPSDTRHSDALHYESWKITVCMITTRWLGSVKGETRETTMASRGVGVELVRRPPGICTRICPTYGVFIVFVHPHGIRAPVRRGENRIGRIQLVAPSASLFPRFRRHRCRDRFGNTVARVHRDRIPRIRATSSRERTTPAGYELVSTTWCTIATTVYRL